MCRLWGGEEGRGGSRPCWYPWATTPTCAGEGGEGRRGRMGRGGGEGGEGRAGPAGTPGPQLPCAILRDALHLTHFPVPTTGPPDVSLHPQGSQTLPISQALDASSTAPHSPASLHPHCQAPLLAMVSLPPVSIPAPKATRWEVSIPCLLSGWQSCQDYCSCKLHNPAQQAETLRTRSGTRGGTR